MKYFTKEHEWISIDADTGIIGITDYAQSQLGDVVYVSLTKDIGENVSAGDDIAEIESVKSVSQIYAPIDGKLVEFNSVFEDESQSGIVNKDPYGEGWILKILINDSSQLDSLMSESDYEEYVKTL